jgi:hypothetical protein
MFASNARSVLGIAFHALWLVAIMPQSAIRPHMCLIGPVRTGFLFAGGSVFVFQNTAHHFIDVSMICGGAALHFSLNFDLHRRI